MIGWAPSPGGLVMSIKRVTMTDRINAVVGPGSDASEHVVAIEPCPRKVRVFFGDQLIAESTRVRLMHETNRLPVYYFPMDDVRMSLLWKQPRRPFAPTRAKRATGR